MSCANTLQTTQSTRCSPMAASATMPIRRWSYGPAPLVPPGSTRPGDLDLYTADCITSLMGRVTGERGAVFDLRDVSFIDSSGLRCLETFRDDVVAGGGRVWLHEPSRAVRRLLAILQIDGFEICGSVPPQRSPHHDPGFAVPRRRWNLDLPDATSGVVYGCGLTIDVTVTQSPAEHSEELPRNRNDVVYAVHGELDAVAARRIGSGGLPCDERVGLVTLDLAGVTIIDSAGVRLIEHFATVVDAAGGRLVLREPNSIVRRVLDVLNVSFDTDPRPDYSTTSPARTTPTRRFERSQRPKHPRRPSATC